jgi:leader peptidase (prepilin peptidase)/N-methyltransferase
LLTGALFLTAYLRTGFNLSLARELILIPVLVAVTVIDVKHLIIPDRIVIFTAAIGVIFAIVFRSNITELAGGIFIPAGILFLLSIISRGGVGGGDIKFMFALGFFLGWLNLLALMIGWILGGIAGMLMLLSGKKGRKDTIAFGPYLAAGVLSAMFWGWEIVQWCVDLLIRDAKFG